jgi:hypothetical protein
MLPVQKYAKKDYKTIMLKAEEDSGELSVSVQPYQISLNRIFFRLSDASDHEIRRLAAMQILFRVSSTFFVFDQGFVWKRKEIIILTET